MTSSSTDLDAGAGRAIRELPLPPILLVCAVFLSGCGSDIDAERIATVMKAFGSSCGGPVRTEFHLGRNDAWLSISCDDIDMEKLK